MDRSFMFGRTFYFLFFPLISDRRISSTIISVESSIVNQLISYEFTFCHCKGIVKYVLNSTKLCSLLLWHLYVKFFTFLFPCVELCTAVRCTIQKLYSTVNNSTQCTVPEKGLGILVTSVSWTPPQDAS